MRIDGTEIFVKRYENDEHYATEVRVLDCLRTYATVAFFVDYLGKHDEAFTLAFPVMDEDVSEYGARLGLNSKDLDALAALIATEQEQMKALDGKGLPVPRAKTPYHFLTELASQGLIAIPQILKSVPTLAHTAILMRYDPQLDNFLLKDQQLYSNDFSLLRRMNPTYPFAYIIHNLIEHTEQGIDPKGVQEHFTRYLTSEAETYLPKGVSAQEMLLLGRAEALSHSVDWNLRRKRHVEASERKKRLNEVLRELACH